MLRAKLYGSGSIIIDSSLFYLNQLGSEEKPRQQQRRRPELTAIAQAAGVQYDCVLRFCGNKIALGVC